MDHLGNWELIQGDEYVLSFMEFLMERFEIEPGRPYGGMVEEVIRAKSNPFPEMGRKTEPMSDGVFEDLRDHGEIERLQKESDYEPSRFDIY